MEVPTTAPQPVTSSVLPQRALEQGYVVNGVTGATLIGRVDSSDSDSDIDDITPPTIIKKKSDLPRKPKSKYKGVFRCGKKFKAQIQTNGVQHYLGLFDLEEEAARAYDVHARATFGLKAKTNFAYESGENIVPTDFLMVQGGENGEDGGAKVKGSHPRRTYVGIKARRKRMAEGDTRPDDVGHGGVLQSPLNSLASASSTSFAMPPRKRLRQGPPIGGDGEGVGDWREQLYHWRGHLSIDTSEVSGGGDNLSGDGSSKKKNLLLWSGTWVGSWQQVAGSESTLAWTGNTFTYRGPPVQEANEGAVSMSVPLKPVSGSYSGHYMMDNEGTGRLSRYSDNACFLDFKEEEGNNGKFSVIGRGDSDFGAFILQGKYDSASRALDVTRKYIIDSDPRAGEKISLTELRASLARDPVKTNTSAPVGMLGGKTLDVVGTVVSGNKEVEI